MANLMKLLKVLQILGALLSELLSKHELGRTRYFLPQPKDMQVRLIGDSLFMSAL